MDRGESPVGAVTSVEFARPGIPGAGFDRSKRGWKTSPHDSVSKILPLFSSGSDKLEVAFHAH
jgi:hypothetical protein